MSWVIPALKAILPHVGDIVAAAKPVFKRKSAGGADALDEPQDEVRAAITQNAEHIQALADQLRKTVEVMEVEAEATRAKLKRAYAWCAVAVVTSLVAVGVALAAWLAR